MIPHAQDAIPTLFARLRASLDASQKAILAGDLVVLEESTREQVLLSQALEPLLPYDSPTEKQDSSSQGTLRSAARRMMHGCRVQAALLERGQRRLRVIFNLVAGTEATYCPCADGAAWLHAGSARRRDDGGN